MKKNLLKCMVALAAMLGLGNLAASAVNPVGKGTVKMTFIDYSAPDSVNGQLDTIVVGYTKSSPAVGGTITFGNTSWGVNKIGVLKADISSVPGTMQKATLKAKVSGSTDSKRTTGWGVALTDNEWAADLTYNTAGSWTVSKMLGAEVWTSTKAATVFEEKEWDVTDAFGSGTTVATLLVYELAAAGGYMTEAYVEVEYEPFEATKKTIDFEDGDASMFVNVNSNRLAINVVDDETLSSKVAEFKVTNRNALPIGFYDFTELAEKAAMVEAEFDFNMGEVAGHHMITIGDALVHNAENGGFSVSSKNNYGYGENGAIFYLGTNRGNLGSGNENYFTVNGVAKAASTLDVKAKDAIFGQWLHAKVIVNVEARTVSYVISNATDTLFAEDGLPFVNEKANLCTEFDVSFSNTGTSYIDNLSITSYKSNAVFADYTIKYVDEEGNELKEARTGNGQVGKFVTLLDADKAAITIDVAEGSGINDKQKYIYKEDDSETVAIAEDAVITVTFRKAEIYTAVLNIYVPGGTATNGGRLAVVPAQKFFEGDQLVVYPYRGYKHTDGAYYFHAPSSWNGYTFTFPGAVTPTVAGGVTYYIGADYYEKVDSVAYYSDIERLALPVEDKGFGTGLGQVVGTVNSWYSFSGGYFDRFSGARGIRLDVGSYVYTEPIEEDGTYQVTIYGRNDSGSAAQSPILGFIAEDGTIDFFDIEVEEWSTALTGGKVVQGVALKAGEKLVIANNGNATSLSLDDVSLTKTGAYQNPVTGINEVKANVNNGLIYNLNGQVVKSAQKGLYIMNGKKYVVK